MKRIGGGYGNCHAICHTDSVEFEVYQLTSCEANYVLGWCEYYNYYGSNVTGAFCHCHN